MSPARILLGVVAGAALATLVATAVRPADAAGDEVDPVPPARKEKLAPAPPAAAAPSQAAPAAWSPPQGPRVTSGVIARAARSAKERDAVPPAVPERRRGARTRGAGTIISLEIDWNAPTAAP